MPLRLIDKKNILVCFVISSMASAVIAAPQVNFQNFVDPGRVGKQVQDSVPTLPKAVPKPELPKFAEPATKEGKIQFKLTRVVFVGNTVFSQAELAKAFAPSLHRNISLVDLQALVQTITVKYRTDGYILSRAILPPQVIKGGVVTVQVIEGFINQVVVEGDPGRARSLLEAYGQHIMRYRPLKVSVLERYALLANDLPGISVKIVVNPSKTTPGGADLTLMTTRKVAGAFAAYDNFGTRYIGPNEFTLGGNLYSLFAGGDNNIVRLSTTSRTQELQYAELDHSQPLGTKGLRLLFGANYAETQPSFVLEPLEILGRNKLAYADLSYPWIRARDRNVNFHAGVNYQNITSTLLSQPYYDDRIRSLVLGTSLDKIDTWRGVNSGALNMIHGFSILGAKDHVNQSRPDGQSTYTRFTLVASRLQGLSPWFSLFAGFSGQYSFEALLATEQFGVGGSDIGRGYDPSEIVGDSGISGKLELRLDTAPELRLLQNVQYYMFYDAGEIWNIDKVNLPAQQSETSAGIGIRFGFIPQVTGNLYLAKPLTRKETTLLILGQNSKQWRGYFQFVANV